MAKTVSDVFLKLNVQGRETLEKLKSSFRSLEKTVGVTDQGVEQLRKETIKYAQASNRSVQSIRGQLDAFKGLRDQAIIGSRAYVQLTSDITRLTGELKRLDVGLKDTEQQAKRTFSQVLGGIPARKPSAFARDIGLLNDELRKYSVTSARYSEILTEITQRTQAFTSAQARQAVIAAARPLQTQAVGAIRVEERLPNTTAALRLQLTELTSALDNADRSSTDYYMIQNRIRNLQQELTAGTNEQAASYDRLAAAQEASTRRAKKLADIQEYMRTQGPMAPGVGGYRDPNTGAMIASGTRAGRQPVPVPAQVREISGLYQQIGDIGMARTRGYIDAMGKSYREVVQDIRAATAASNGSINSLNSQRAAWTTLRNSLEPASEAYREVGREIAKVDKRLARVSKGGRMGRVGKNLAAGAGGMLSGGIFGGPEGAIGGLIGGLGFGPQGAIAGAAVGAQVSQFRQQAAGVAEFNAELTLAKKTLAQASTGIDDYNRLIGLARQVSSDYAVSLKPAVSGLAQIATAARANNLSFEQTEAIYRGLIASNVAFGKSQEDLDAIIRATVQVLSKGKVSAEELSGQIGERLPGAVAKFAAANNMSLSQLTEAFKKGEVTIAQFVKFARAQGDEYGKIAEKIAEGPEKAGLRLQIALEESAEIFGGFFAKIGAGSQDFFTSIVKLFNNLSPYIKQFVTNFVNGAIIVGETARRIIFGAYQFAQKAVSLLEQISPLFKLMTSALKLGAANLQKFLQMAPGAASAYANFAGIKTYTVDELFPKGDPTSFGGGGLTSGAGDGSGGKDKGSDKAANALARRVASAKEIVRKLKDQLDISKQQRPLDEFIAKQAKERSDFEARFAKLRKDGKDATIEQAYKEAQILLTRKQRADLEKYYFENLKGMGTQLSENLEKEKQLSRELIDRRYALGLVGKDEYVSSQLDAYKDQLTGQGYSDDAIAAAMEVRRQELDPTPFEQMRQNIAQLKQELTDLLNPVNQITGAANAIGTAFSTSFINVINGSQTTQEALAGFFKNIGNYFLDMAAQIIAKMIQMAILNAVVGLLPGAGGGGLNIASAASGAGASYGGGAASGLFGGSSSVSGYSFGGGGNFGGGFGAYLGDTPFTNLPFLKRAYGGPVKGKMPYLVGENGPELYVPGMSGKIVPNHKLPQMVDLGGKFMPFHPLFMAAMFGLGNFGGNRQAVMERFGAKFSPYSGGAMVGRAAGGPVTGGSPYLVGESGPEMYVPQGFSGASMKSTSNNVVVNVNATGSQAEGDGPDSKRLGEAIGAAVRQELMRQQRPGGILA